MNKPIQTIAITIGIILILLGLIVSFSQDKKTDITPVATSTPQINDIKSEQLTLSGTYTDCLPHEDSFSAEPCRAGIKTDDGAYFVLDYNLYTQTIPTFKNGDQLIVSGLFTPIEMLSSDLWEGGIAKGILSVSDIKKQEVVTPVTSKPVIKPLPGKEPATGTCYIGGCSGQICSGEQGMVSTCEYREQYACYKTAKCERQSTGKCGWTETSQLKTCLAS